MTTYYLDLKNNVAKYKPLTENIAQEFGGPSIYFHQKAIELGQKDFLSEQHLEYIYATLASWGMHRMGKTGAKLVDFEKFKCSILSQKTQFQDWQKLSIEKLSKNDFEALLPELTKICFSLRTSTSSVNLVANTKTVAHILPNLVPPIDREYTLKFVLQKKHIVINPKNEQEIFQNVMKTMFDFFQLPAIIQMLPKITLGENNFNTSYPKIFDNLIIAYMKHLQPHKSEKK